ESERTLLLVEGEDDAVHRALGQEQVLQPHAPVVGVPEGRPADRAARRHGTSPETRWETITLSGDERTATGAPAPPPKPRPRQPGLSRLSSAGRARACGRSGWHRRSRRRRGA